MKKATDSSLLQYHWPYIDKKLERVVIKQLHDSISIYDRSGIFERFEDSFAAYHNRSHGLLMSSGTLAIHSMYVAAGFKAGDEVICPAYTFFATVTPLLFTGAVPILCDCDENGNIDPSEIKNKITGRTKGVVITHMWGVPCQLDAIVKLCKENGLLLLEDCSHAHGACYNGQPVGCFGDIAAWSIQGAKNVTGGEGGIMLTNNDDMYYKALLLGHYNKRCKQEIPKSHPLYRYAATGMGLKYRAHPLAIAIANEVFAKLNMTLQTRNTYAEMILHELRDLRGLEGPHLVPGSQPSWYAIIFQYNARHLSGTSIDKFAQILHALGLKEIDLPGSTIPLNLLPLFQEPEALFPMYKGIFSYKKGDFPRSERFSANAIKIPVWARKQDKSIVRAYIKGIKQAYTIAVRETL